MGDHSSSSPFIFLMKNLDVLSPFTYTETYPDVDSENENGGINSMSLKSDLKSKTIIEFPTIYVLLRPGSMPLSLSPKC